MPSPIRRLVRPAVLLAALALTAAPAWAQNTYTWNRTTSASWTSSSNWTPSRSSPQSSDILVFNGTTTPSPTVTGVPSQTIGRLRVINNAQLNLSTSTSGGVTVTIGSSTAPSLEVTSGARITLSGTQRVTLSLGSSATASIAGGITLSSGAAHTITPTTAGSFVFTSGGSLTTNSGYNTAPFGTTGTANLVTFQSGSSYIHNGGQSIHGLTAPSSKVVFQAGSTIFWRTTAGYSSQGRTYSDMVIQNNTAISGSGTSNLTFRSLTVESGSSFTHAGSSGALITITGNISSSGTGNISITPGTGGISLSGGTTQTIGGGGGTGTITFGGNANVGSTTALVITNRALAFSAGAMTVNGSLQFNQGGSTSGSTAFVYGASSTLIFNNTSGSFGVNSTSNFWPSTNSPPNVTVQGAGGITMNAGANRTISGTFRVAGPVTNANQITITGTLERQTGGSVTGAPVYSGTSATLRYVAGLSVGAEWGSGTAVGSGVPRHVTINAPSATVTMPNSTRSIPGDLLISAGTFALNATSGDLTIAGNWTNNGAFTQNGRLVTFNGTADQIITRTGGESLSPLTIDKSGGQVVLSEGSATSLTVSGATGTPFQIVNAGGLFIGSNSLNFTGSGGNVGVSGTTAGTRTINGTGTVNFNGAKTVTSGNSRTLAFGSGVRVVVAAPVNFGASITTINGILQMSSGGSITTNPPTYAAGAILRYSSGGTFGRGVEWSTNSGPGYPFHVEIQGNTTLDLGNGGVAVARQCAGNLTIQSGSTLTTNNGANAMTATVNVLGNLVVDGTMTLSALAGGNAHVHGNMTVNGTYTDNGRALIMQGAATQTLGSTAGLTLSYLRLAKTAGSVQLTSALSITAPAGGNAIDWTGTTDLVDLNGQSLTVTSAIGGTNPNGQFRGNGTSSLTINGSGALGTLRFASGGQNLGQLTVNRTSSGTVTLGTPLSVSGTLLLSEGQLLTGANVLTVPVGGTINRLNGHVVGLLARGVATGAQGVSFPIGSSASYLPVTVQFPSVTTAGTLTVSTTGSDHPNLGTSGIAANRTVNRYWTLLPSGLAFTTANVTVTYGSGEVDAGVNLTRTGMKRYSGGSWSSIGSTGITTTSAQAVNVTSFGDLVVGELPVFSIASSSGPNGTISPIGSVEVVEGGSQTYTMVPDEGYHVQEVLVDGSPVGAVNEYTFEGVVAPHSISVTFAINVYVLTLHVSGEGTATNAPQQPTWTHGEFTNLTATPAQGWEFVNWTGTIVNTLNPVQLRMDMAHVVTANFVRTPMRYLRTTFATAYQPLSTGTGASRLLTVADDSTRSFPLPFPFIFSGIPYTTANHMAVSANGFMYFSRASVTSSSATQANNSNLYSVTSPNQTLAPWYDDLSCGPVGSNPSGPVLYQVHGAPGSRTLTVQWTGVSSYANTTGGQPRTINFQVILFETTNQIEFRYGPISGSTSSTLESASIALEDSLGGNGNYIDGVTGSKVTFHGMMTTNKWPARHIRFVPATPTPIASGTYMVGSGQTYANLTDAVADLNQRGVSGPVTFRLTDAVSDTSAAGGANFFPILISRVTGTSAVNTVTIEPQSGTSIVRYRGTESGNCGNQSITNLISSSNEPVIGLVGSDYITLRNLAIEGGPTVDRGLLLLPSSTSDGAQNNTAQSIAVSLSRSNTSSLAIQQFMPVTPVGTSGTNSNNRYHNLNVSNVYAGISLAGNVSFPDQSCEVAVTGGGQTVIGGATAGDIGGGTSQTFGVRATNQRDVKIFGVEVRNLLGTGSGAVDGILLENLATATFNSGTCEIHDNKVHDLDNSSLSAGRVTGIRAGLSSNASSVSRIYNNFVYGLNSSSTSTVSRRMVGIYVQDAGGGTGATHNVDFNSVRIAPMNLGFSNACFESGNSSGPVIRVRNNVFANFVGTQSGNGKHYCWVSPTAVLGAAGSFSDRNVLHINNTANGHVGLTGSDDRSTLADWQAATSHDLTSVPSNPQFETPSNIHISLTRPSPVESRGSYFSGAITWVPADIDGEPRNPSTPDVGADEGTFNQLVANDIAASAFVDPADASLKVVGLSFVPSVTFENAGTSPQTNVPVRYRIIGPQPATTVVYDRTTTIPTIAAGTTETVTFPSGSVPTTGMFTIQATAEMISDQNHGNDQAGGVIEIIGPLSGTRAVGAIQPFPFNTITNAIARLNLVGVSGPLTLLLQDPSYTIGETFPIQVEPITGSSATNKVTLKPAPGVTSIIQGSAPRAIFVLNGCDYFTIDGSNTVGGTTRNLRIHNYDGNPASATIWGQTSSTGDPVTNCSVQNTDIWGSTVSMMGVGFGGTTIGPNSGGSGNHNNSVINCHVRQVQYGIYSSGFNATTKNTGTVISGNDIGALPPSHVQKAGVLIRYENGTVVTQNRITDLESYEHVSVIGIALGLTNGSSSNFIGDEVTNATVTRNVIDGVKSTSSEGRSAIGISLASATTGTTMIANNMVSRVTSPALDPDLTAGVLVGGGAGSTTRIYFNSISMTGDRGAGTSPSFALCVGGINPIVDIRNNILSNTQTTTDDVGEGYAIGLNYSSPYSNLTSNYNLFQVLDDFFGVTGGLLNSPDGDTFDLPAWRTMTAKDGNSREGDPKFVSASNLHIQQSGSAAANVGSVLAAVTTDVDGDPGNRATTPDIGADEFGTQTLAITIVGSGSVTKSPDQPNYITGTTVTLTATPVAGNQFVSWSGGATGSTNPLAVVMTSDKSITANFAINTYTLNVTTVGSGSVVKSPNQPTYNHGSTVNLTPAPAVGWTFTGWSGDASGNAIPLAVPMTSNRNITATFTINTYTLGTSVVGNGSIAKSPDQPNYNHGTVVTLTATPAPGHSFIGWSGGASGTTNPLPLTMDGNKTVTATFAISSYTVATTTVGNGTVVKSPNQATYNHGTALTLTATPAVGHTFVGWSGDTTTTTNPLPIVVVQNRSYTATFVINEYTQDVVVNGDGNVTRSPDQPTYTHGTPVTFTATPDPGHTFLNWSGDTSGTANPLVLTATANRVITANFTLGVTVAAVGSGTVSKSPNQVSYMPGAGVTLTATPDPGHSFIGWTGDATGTTNPLPLTLTASMDVTAQFTRALVVNVTGNGSVAKAPDQVSYAPGAEVVLTATPVVGNHFVGWGGDASGSDNPITVTMDDDRTITATFEVTGYTLGVATVGDGAVNRSPDQPTYLHGTIVTLTANPAPGHHFVSWSGDASGTANPVNVTMDGAKSVTATFAINTYTLATPVVGTGSVAKSPDQPTYTHGTVVNLTATPGGGQNFVGWSGDASGATNPLAVTMDANKTITATFDINTYTLSVGTTGSGTVNRSPDQASYAHGANVTLTAVPATGHHFVSWGGDASGSTNPLGLLMDGNKSVTATFAINTYTLNVTPVGNGSVGKAPDQPTYTHGTTVVLTATPLAGHHLESWSGDASGSANPLDLVMDGNKNVTATFAINTYTLNTTIVGNGSVAKAPDQPTYAHGTTASLTATPGPGWHFVAWSGDAGGTANPVDVTMNGDKNVTATFAINTYSLSVPVIGHGSVGRSPDQPAYDHGTLVTLTATPEPTHSFVGWSGGATGTTNPLVVTMDAAKTITASFTVTLNVTSVGNGSVAKSPDQPNYLPGTTVTLTATPAAAHHLVAWSGDASGSTNPLPFVLDQNANVTATFAINSYPLDVTAVGNGTVSKSPDQATYDHGTTVLLSPAAAVGHHFVAWTGDAGGAADPLSVVMDGPKSIGATFQVNTYTLDVVSVGNGSVAKSPDLPTYNYGATVTLTANPDVGHHFATWSGDVSGSANPLDLVIGANTNVTATFEIDMYTLDVTSFGPGHVDRVPDQPLYAYGTTPQLVAVPDPGYHLESWGGDATGATTPLPMLMDENKDVTATFVINTYPLNVTIVGNGTVAKSPDQATYDHGTTVLLTATPAPGHRFVSWSGDAIGTLDTRTVLMNSIKNVTATFELITYTVGVTTIGSGNVNAVPQQPSYLPGTQVVLFALADPGHRFVSWGGPDGSGTSNPLLLTMDGNKTLTATFEIRTYTLTTQSTGGSVARSPDLAQYTHGTTVQLTAVPDSGHHFRDWLGDASGTSNPINVLMTRDMDITARFLPNTFTVTMVSGAGSGTFEKHPNLPRYDPGTKVDVGAIPAAGFQFLRWTFNTGDTVTANPMSVTADSNLTLTAEFVPGGAPVLSTVIVGEGTVVPDQPGPSYVPGTWIYLTATPAPGWRFVSWAGVQNATGNPLAVFMDRDHTITATFAPDAASLTVNTIGQGTVAKSPDQPSYPYGTPVQLTATPGPGYHFVGWSGDLSGSTNPATITMDDNRTVTATFGFGVTLAVSGPGSVATAPNPPFHAPGTLVSVTATANPGAVFMGWSGDTMVHSNPLPIQLYRDWNLTANFANTAYVLDVQVSGSGSVIKTPDQAGYLPGTVVELRAEPVPGFRFAGWNVNAADDIVDLGPPGPGGGCTGCNGTTENPILVTMNGDHSMVATFEPIPGLLVATSTGEGEILRRVRPGGSDLMVEMTAVAQSGHRFVGWSGAVSGAENPTTVDLAAGGSLVARFVEAVAPTVRLEPLPAGTKLETGTRVRLSWTSMDNVGVSAVEFQVSRRGVEGPFEKLASGLAAEGSFEWTVSGDPAENACLRIVARDAAGNEGFASLTHSIESAIPAITAFAVSRIFPNPMTTEADIELAMPREARVRVSVHDAAGREVAVLADGVQSAGYHHIRWNGRSASGRAAAGVYFVRLRTAGAESVKRLILAH